MQRLLRIHIQAQPRRRVVIQTHPIGRGQTQQTLVPHTLRVVLHKARLHRRQMTQILLRTQKSRLGILFFQRTDDILLARYLLLRFLLRFPLRFAPPPLLLALLSERRHHDAAAKRPPEPPPKPQPNAARSKKAAHDVHGVPSKFSASCSSTRLLPVASASETLPSCSMRSIILAARL